MHAQRLVNKYSTVRTHMHNSPSFVSQRLETPTQECFMNKNASHFFGTTKPMLSAGFHCSFLCNNALACSLILFLSSLSTKVSDSLPLCSAYLSLSPLASSCVSLLQFSFNSSLVGISGHTNGLSNSTVIFLMARGRNHRLMVILGALGLPWATFC
jgi:hypothetical protein